jgi:type IV pilus assembly protein PilX
MLGERFPCSMNGASRFYRQQGLVLIIVLIVLVAMTLAGIALMRSVNTSTLVAGNLALRQAAAQEGDTGTEYAITWLQNNAGGTALNQNILQNGYFASYAFDSSNPGSGQTWDAFWSTLDPTPVARPVTGTAVNSGSVWTLPTDTATGNTVSYIIQRLCSGQYAPTDTKNNTCVTSPTSTTAQGDSYGVGATQFISSSQIYYRITSRIEGPRNTVSYVQTYVAM